MPLTLKSQQGISLIEILVSVLILSIGLLGLAAMQSNGLKQNRNAYYRTQATVLAYDIIDRMRANDSEASSGNYAMDYGSLTGTQCSSNCTPAQITTTDKLQWKANLASQLPSGDGSVTDQGNSQYTVNIRWTDGDGTTDPISIGVQL